MTEPAMIKYIKRVFKEPDSSYFLFGPRGTGKSTMTVERHPDALLVDLRLADSRYRFSANPDELKDLVMAQPNNATIIIDEIQKVPDLLPIVHLLIEKKKGWKFILTGSSARKLKRQGVDLLGGRALKKTLYPFIAFELKKLFSLSEALLYGLLPLRFGQKNPAETLAAYISLYLEEEVKTEGLIRNYALFARFLQTMSLSQGSILNTTNVARECFVKRTTVNDWISILEDLLIGYKIEVFENRAKRSVSSHPKFYFFDAGVYHALRPKLVKDDHLSIEGIALETLVMQHLVAWKDYSSTKNDIFFWRTKANLEVDFIVFGELGFWAIEVKNNSKVHTGDVKNLVEFKKDYPEATSILLYRGKEKIMKNGILCLPCEDFLLTVEPNNPLYKI